MANHHDRQADSTAEVPSDANLPANMPLLLQGNFTSSSTGSMELVGLRERKPARVLEFESQFRQPEEKTRWGSFAGVLGYTKPIDCVIIHEHN
jgi:hypothetical protein